jgi:hypothetical protein
MNIRSRQIRHQGGEKKTQLIDQEQRKINFLKKDWKFLHLSEHYGSNYVSLHEGKNFYKITLQTHVEMLQH